MAFLQALSRRATLSVAQNSVARRVAARHGMKLGAARFVAGEDSTSAMNAVRELNRHGIMATLDQLGEFVSEHNILRTIF